MTQHDDVVAGVLFDGVDATERRLHAQRAIDVGGHRQAANLQRLAVEHDRESSRPHHAEMVEGAGALAPHDKVRGRDAVSHGPASVCFPNCQHSIGLVVGQRLEEDRADHAEHGGGGADAERQRQQRGNCEARRAQQRAHAVSQVARECVEVRFPANVAHMILDRFGAAYLGPGSAQGRVMRQAVRDLGFDGGVQVRAQFLVELALDPASPDQGAKACNKSAAQLHEGSPATAFRMRAIAKVWTSQSRASCLRLLRPAAVSL